MNNSNKQNEVMMKNQLTGGGIWTAYPWSARQWWQSLYHGTPPNWGQCSWQTDRVTNLRKRYKTFKVDDKAWGISRIGKTIWFAFQIKGGHFKNGISFYPYNRTILEVSKHKPLFDYFESSAVLVVR